MVTTPKQPAGKPTRKPASKTPASRKASAGSEPSMHFVYDGDLHGRVLQLFDDIEKQPDQHHQGEALASLVTDLIQTGMEHYFIRGLKLANMGFVAEQSAKLGVSGAVTLLSSVCRKYIVRMDHAQRLAVAQHMRALG